MNRTRDLVLMNGSDCIGKLRTTYDHALQRQEILNRPVFVLDILNRVNITENSEQILNITENFEQILNITENSAHGLNRF